jgi:hypothetical protein
MTAAQKAAKEKFSKAIAYRSKTGVSLKEAFAHVYNKKVGAVKKVTAKKSNVVKEIKYLPIKLIKGESAYLIESDPTKNYDVYSIYKNGDYDKKIKVKKLKNNKNEYHFKIGAVIAKKSALKKAATKKLAPKKVATSHKDTKSHNVNIRVVSGVIAKDINRSILSYEKLKQDVKDAMSDYKKSKDVVSKFYAKQKLDKLKHELRERKFVLTNLNKELKKIK